MLCGDIYAKIRNRLGSGYSMAVSSYSKSDGSSQCPHRQLSPSTPEMLVCAFKAWPATSCAVCQALAMAAGLVWPVPCILLGSTWQEHHLWAVHVSSRNPKPQVWQGDCPVASTGVLYHHDPPWVCSFLFKIHLWGFWGNPVFPQTLSMENVVQVQLWHIKMVQ